jgi:hypothetical protein
LNGGAVKAMIPRILSYELRIWDPARHAPLPASAGEALELMERLTAVSDTRNSRIEKFGAALVACYEAELSDSREPGGLAAFWGSDPRATTAACRTAVYQLSIPFEDPTKQICAVVHAAAGHGLVVFDDENGMCFLPDGTVFPEDVREMWASTLADLKADPPDPAKGSPDGRTMLETIAGELFDAIGRGNKRLS